MIQAQPNKTWMKFQVLKKWKSNNFPGKTELQLKVLASNGNDDLRFIIPGEIMEGFTFEDDTLLDDGVVLRAEGEYIGGPKGGKVQLFNIKIESKTK